MAVKYLDWENKAYVPTQQLIGVVKQEVVEYSEAIKSYWIHVHGRVAELSIEWYEHPVETTQRWSSQGFEFLANEYEQITLTWVPQIVAEFHAISATLNHGLNKTRQTLDYVSENPREVIAATTDSVVASLNEVETISGEVIIAFRQQVADVIELLLRQPVETLESAYLEALNALLETYFQLTTLLLQNL